MYIKIVSADLMPGVSSPPRYCAGEPDWRPMPPPISKVLHKEGGTSGVGSTSRKGVLVNFLGSNFYGARLRRGAPLAWNAR